MSQERGNLMKMEVTSYSWKLVKPSMPTPTTRRSYNLSFTDELAPTINVPLILYYSAPPNSNDRSQRICDHLEDSLSKTLTEFYPLAGRCIRSLSLVDCNDQGALYVRGKANVRLSDILRHPDLPNQLVPEIKNGDEADDPMLSIKVTTFVCGGFAIGMLFSHKISDMGTMCTFIKNWAGKTNSHTLEDEHTLDYAPVFNSAIFFPPKGLPELDLRAPSVKTAARRFHFTKESITAMSKRVSFPENGHFRRPSKVQLVVALLWTAFRRIDQANDGGRCKESFLIQPVGLRDTVIPRLPQNSCGNFWGLASCELGAGEGENDNENDIRFEDVVELLRDSVRKMRKDCSKILTHGEEGYGIVIDTYLESNQKIADNDVNFYLFTCWCKFSFYEADFGYGKPCWASTKKLDVQNVVIMMDDHEGDGVEAWVHLDEKRMKDLDQDYEIRTYAFC